MPLQGPYPQPGDLIEFFRPAYQHWGVYVGDGYVVHLSDLSGLSGLSSVSNGMATVKKDTLHCVAAGNIYRVNNKDSKNRNPLPPEIIVQNALKEVGETKEYSLTHYNCEHFATELRYEDGSSDQVKDAWMYTAIAFGALGVIALFTGAAYSTNRKRRQNQ